MGNIIYETGVILSLILAAIASWTNLFKVIRDKRVQGKEPLARLRLTPNFNIGVALVLLLFLARYIQALVSWLME